MTQKRNEQERTEFVPLTIKLLFLFKFTIKIKEEDFISTR